MSGHSIPRSFVVVDWSILISAQVGYGGRSSHPGPGPGAGSGNAERAGGAGGDLLATTLFNPGGAAGGAGGAGAGRSRGVASARNTDVLLGKRGEGGERRRSGYT